MQILQTNIFKKAVKKLHANQKFVWIMLLKIS
jgi:hypothetical protein